MATASPGPRTNRLLCPICEERYNERDHTPKTFTCPHTVCISCLQQMVQRSDGEEVTCPLCRQTVAIPESGAAGFSTNLAVLDIVRAEGAALKCKQHDDKTASMYCMTCHEVMCTKCVVQAKHNGHEIQELPDAMENCAQRSEKLLDDILSSCSSITTKCTEIHKLIKKQAQEANHQCLENLQRLQTYQMYLDIDKKEFSEPSCRRDDPAIPPSVAAAVVLQQPHLSSKSDGKSDLASLPLGHDVNSNLLRCLVSSKLPEFKLIDINRRNTVLLTFPDGDYALYRMYNKAHKEISRTLAPDKLVKSLLNAETILLSRDGHIVTNDELNVSCNGETCYSFTEKRYMCEVRVYNSDWMALVYRTAGEYTVKIMHLAKKSTIFTKNFRKSNSKPYVVPTNGYSGVAIYANSVAYIAVVERDYTECYRSKLGYSLPDVESCIAMVQRRLLVLVDKTIRVHGVCYDPCEEKEYTVESKYEEITMKDLGLSRSCEIERIWAGESYEGPSVLHVLYSQPDSGYGLASYAFKL